MREIVEVALFTADVAAAKAFYGDLLAAEPEAEWPGGAIFAAGPAKLLLHERGDVPEGGPPNEDHFALAVRALDDTCRELAEQGSRSSSGHATIRGVARRTSGTQTDAWSSSARRRRGS